MTNELDTTKPNYEALCQKHIETLLSKSMTATQRQKVLGKYSDIVFMDKSLVAKHQKVIVGLHDEVCQLMLTGLEKAISIGGLLCEVKQCIRHGFFQKWIEINLLFSTRTAQLYMKLYHYREELKAQEIALLTDAYSFIRGEASPDEVVEVNDSTDTSGVAVIVNDISEVDGLPNVPRKKAKGLMRDVTIDEETIRRINGKEYPFDDAQERYIKLVVTTPKWQMSSDETSLLGQFVAAASSLLKPGGKLIFVKK